jgi:hypothetical protein
MVRSRSSKANETEPQLPPVAAEAPRIGDSLVAADKGLDLTGGASTPLPKSLGGESRTTGSGPRTESLPNGGCLPPLPDGYSAVVTSVFNLPDPYSVYTEIVEGIRPLKVSRLSMSDLMDVLDRAQSVVIAARGLLVNTKITVDGVKRDTDRLMAAMRDQASTQLEREKEAGMRKKAITNDDVMGYVATMFQDEWAACQERDAKARRTISMIEAICESAIERARDLRAIVAASRSV